MTGLILQARLDSTRLPGKALLDLGGEPMVFRVMEALREVQCELHVLACPEDSADAFRGLAHRAGFELAIGPKNDVLARYCLVLEKFGLDRVIRATGDNPFVFADAAALIAAESRELDADYAGYAGLPYGAGVEVVSAAALLRAAQEAQLPEEREHVCPYLYGHPELFRLHRPLCPRKWQAPQSRITVDNPSDYARAQQLYAKIAPPRYTGEAILQALFVIDSVNFLH